MSAVRLSLVACAAAVSLSLSAPAHAAYSFVNGLALSGAALDLSGGTSANNGRVGYFSDLYFDPNRNEWWGLSDRGPGGGTLDYDTRVQRFTLDVNADTGAISNFRIVETVRFTDASGQPFNGLAPNPADTLGRSFDPEGMVINPRNGHMLVSDEYGPSVYEFNRQGTLVRTYTTPDNLVPKVGGSVNYNASATTLTSGREGNRGLEGLTISPDGRHAYAMLQDGTVVDGQLNAAGTSLTRSTYTRIVKFDTTTGEAVGQYAYRLDRNGQGQGISAIVALGNDRFMVLERNNRGVGVGADLATADKNVYMVDLAGATDVTGLELPTTGNLPAGVVGATKGDRVIDLDAHRIDLDGDGVIEAGEVSPEKWEGLAVGPRLNDGSYLILAGTDNDYSVTQNGTGTQFDVYFDFSQADPYAASIQCPLGQTVGCTLTSNGLPAVRSADHQLLPGVLHAYRASAADMAGYVAPVPEPASIALTLSGLALVGAWVRRRRTQG